jgi:hypothetical protein
MKSNEKLGSFLKDENHFISLLFTLRASRRLPSAALFRPRHPAYSGIASALNAPLCGMKHLVLKIKGLLLLYESLRLVQDSG